MDHPNQILKVCMLYLKKTRNIDCSLKVACMATVLACNQVRQYQLGLTPPPPLHTSHTTLSLPPSSSFFSFLFLLDYFASPGTCGLLNLGNTCYMNAGLQCVFGIQRIAKFYLSKDLHVARVLVVGGCIVCTMYM